MPHRSAPRRPLPSGAVRLLPLLLLLLLAPRPAAAQEPADTVPAGAVRAAPEPSPEEAERIAALVNDPATIRLSGRTRVPAGRALVGDVAVLGGPLTVGGRIEGRVVVLNGAVELEPGAEVTGELVVVGGGVTGLEGAAVGGGVAVYARRFPYRRLGERIVLTSPRAPGGEEAGEAAEPGRFGGWMERADFVVATGQSYNRVEGFPVTFGPVLETAGSNPFRLRAEAVYRTEEGLSLDDARWGWQLRAEQMVGGRRAVRVGAELHSLIDPVEAWHVSKLENGLSTFFLHRDYRDHWLREGWSAYVRLAPEDSPLSATAEYRDEEHDSRAAGSPWTLFRNDDPWRPQPLVGEGRLRSAAVHGEWDTRPGDGDPDAGWWIRASVEQSLEVELARPEAVVVSSPDAAPGSLLAGRAFGHFTAGSVDLRRYARLGPSSRLNLRLYAAGALNGGALPPQRQHALGGEGSLPGYGLFSLDCGARRTELVRPEDLAPDDGSLVGEPPPRFVPRYGCDRVVLAQVEHRGRLSLRLDLDDDPWEEDGEDDGGALGALLPLAPYLRDGAEWVVFVDAARAWSVDGGDERTAVDVGAGVRVGRVGVYGAVPLRGAGGVDVFVRLAPRF